LGELRVSATLVPYPENWARRRHVQARLNIAPMRRQRFGWLAVAFVIVLGACTASEVTNTTDTNPEPEPPVELPEGWAPVDHPLVKAIRASNSIEPPSNAVDGLDDTSWVSGADAPQWIELDLGSPVDIASITLVVDQAPPGRTVHEITAGAHEVPGMSMAVLDGETDLDDRLEVSIDKTVQFIRITTTESPSWVSWVEIEIEEAS